MGKRQRAYSEKPRQRRDKKAQEASVENILTSLTTPMLRNLHLEVMQRTLHSSAHTYQNSNESAPKLVASVFVCLYNQEVEQFLEKPSPAKTRRWRRYRKCLERIFDLTPPSILFACPGGHPAFSEHSANVLDNIWNQYGQRD